MTYKQKRIIDFIRRNLGKTFDPEGPQTAYDFIGQHKKDAELAYARNWEPADTVTISAGEWGGIPNM